MNEKLDKDIQEVDEEFRKLINLIREFKGSETND